MTRVAILSLLVMSAAACGDDPENTPPIDAPPVGVETGCDIAGSDFELNSRTCVVVGERITTNTTWTKDKIYVIPNFQKSFVQKPAVLTIQPGTEIRAGRGAVLTVSRGAQIQADGTAQEPILFTANLPTGMKVPGHWGGLLVLGYAIHNTNAAANPPNGEVLFEAFSNADGESGRFGSPIGMDIPNDNSGVIRYVRIEFGGYNFVADREFNNLTLCGVGSGTTVDYVQVHAGQDDGIELFGGTVNVKHIVSSQNEDDGFDIDNGWKGKAQFVVVQNIAHRAGAVLEATNGYEIDNHASSFESLPRTEPIISNVTLIGDRDYAEIASWAGIFRRGSAGHFINHIWFNFPRGPEIRDAATQTQVTANALTVSYSMLYKNERADTNEGNLPLTTTTPDIAEANVFSTAAPANNKINTNPGLPAAATSRTAPDFKPVAGAAALVAANAAPMDHPRLQDPFFEKVPFVGAIGTTDWTLGWTRYPQN